MPEMSIAEQVDAAMAENPKVPRATVQRVIEMFNVFVQLDPDDVNTLAEVDDEVLGIVLALITDHMMDGEYQGDDRELDGRGSLKVGVAIGIALGISWKEYLHS